MKKILIVEDNIELNDIMRNFLIKAGHLVYQAFDGEMALDMAKKLSPNLVILDIMMPKKDGFEVCRELRNFLNVPVIVVSAVVGEEEKIKMFDLGADDYITKPFSPKVLIARVNSVVRRSKKSEVKINNQDFICVNKLKIDIKKHEISWDNKFIDFSATEFAIVEFLAKNAGQVFSRDKILSYIWGVDFFGETRTVDVHIGTLRTKIGACGDYIQTVRGVGYKMESEQ